MLGLKEASGSLDPLGKLVAKRLEVCVECSDRLNESVVFYC